MENRLYPMRELLGDLLLESGRSAQALAEYEASMSASPNRFNALVGAAKAAVASDNPTKASEYYAKLRALAGNADTIRPDLLEAQRYLSVVIQRSTD